MTDRSDVAEEIDPPQDHSETSAPDRPAEAPTRRPSTGELLRGTPAAVWLLVALTGAVTMLMAVFYPNFRAPDELPQVGLVVSVAQRSVDWQPGSMHMPLGVQKAPLQSPNRLHGSLHLGKGNVPSRDARPNYEQLGGAKPTHFINYIAQHPPLYYLSLGSALSVIPHWRTMPFDRVVLLLRLITALMILPVPWFLYAAARTLGGSRGIATAAAATPLMSPQLIHISSAVNNDALLTLLGSAAVFLAAGVYRGDLSRRRVGQLGVLCAAITLTKGFGLVVALLVVALYVISLVRHRAGQGLLRPLLRCTAWFAPPVLLASTWWIGNDLQYQRIQPDGTLPPSRQHECRCRTRPSRSRAKPSSGSGSTDSPRGFGSTTRAAHCTAAPCMWWP